MLLHLPVGLSSHQTAQRRLSGAHNDRSQSHRQWLAVTAPAGRAHAVERVEATCRREPRCCQTKQVPKKGVEGRRRDARRRPKKLRFISRGKKALAHPSLLPLTRTTNTALDARSRQLTPAEPISPTAPLPLRQPLRAQPQQPTYVGPPARLQQLPSTVRPGDAVVVPASLWPAYSCKELGGAGWTATIRRVHRSTARVSFDVAQTRDGRPYENELLPLDDLRVAVV